MDDKHNEQPEAAHAASEIEEPKHDPYSGDGIVLKFLLVVLTLATLLLAWVSLEG